MQRQTSPNLHPMLKTLYDASWQQPGALMLLRGGPCCQSEDVLLTQIHH
jgi:hypothetical protein